MRNGRLLRKGTSMKRLYFIGTNDASAQDGIQALSWDGDSLRLEKTAGGGPACTSYLTLTPDGYLLACVERDSFLGVSGGGLVCCKHQNGTIRTVSTLCGLGKGPCQVCYLPENRLVFTAGYQDGSVDMALLAEDGTLTHVKRAQRSGRGPHPEQTGPHAHCCLALSGEKSLLVCDLGTDEIVEYQLPELTVRRSIRLPAGSGPRHAALSRNRQLLYVACELSNDVMTIRLSDGALLQKFSHKPDSGEFKALSSIRLTQDGTRLVVGCRGDDGVLAFEADAAGLLAEPVFLETACSFLWDALPVSPNGDYLLAAFEREGCLQALFRDGDQLKTLAEFRLPHPTCVLAAGELH